MREPYDNQAAVDKAQRMVESICPSLKITSCSLKWNSNVVIEVGVTLPVKGNKEIIDKLVSIGFIKGHKRKKDFYNYWSISESYSMLIDMRMPLSEPPKEG